MFPPRTRLDPAGAGPGGAAAGRRVREAGPSLEVKGEAVSRRRGAQQRWPERWLEQQPPLLQLTLPTATASLKVSNWSENIKPKKRKTTSVFIRYHIS